MGGYHIAEALRIPYFRAFTMTWSRTRYSGFFGQRNRPLIYMYRRAYPHAFAVPERKVGNIHSEFTFFITYLSNLDGWELQLYGECASHYI